jgi:hypothetical protein
MLPPQDVHPVSQFRRRVPGFDTTEGEEIEETPGIDRRVDPVEDMDRGPSPALVGIVFDIVVNKTGIVGQFHQGNHGQRGVPSPKAFAD